MHWYKPIFLLFRRMFRELLLVVKHVSNYTRDDKQSQSKQKAVIHSNALLTSQSMKAQHKQFIDCSRLNPALYSLTAGQPLPSAIFAEPLVLLFPHGTPMLIQTF